MGSGASTLCVKVRYGDSVVGRRFGFKRFGTRFSEWEYPADGVGEAVTGSFTAPGPVRRSVSNVRRWCELQLRWRP